MYEKAELTLEWSTPDADVAALVRYLALKGTVNVSIVFALNTGLFFLGLSLVAGESGLDQVLQWVSFTHVVVGFLVVLVCFTSVGTLRIIQSKLSRCRADSHGICVLVGDEASLLPWGDFVRGFLGQDEITRQDLLVLQRKNGRVTAVDLPEGPLRKAVIDLAARQLGNLSEASSEMESESWLTANDLIIFHALTYGFSLGLSIYLISAGFDPLSSFESILQKLTFMGAFAMLLAIGPGTIAVFLRLKNRPMDGQVLTIIAGLFNLLSLVVVSGFISITMIVQ